MLKTNFSVLEISRRREIWESIKDSITDQISQQDWLLWNDRFDESASTLVTPVVNTVNDYITNYNLGNSLDADKFRSLFVRNLKIMFDANKDFMNSQLMKSKELLTETLNKIQ